MTTPKPPHWAINGYKHQADRITGYIIGVGHNSYGDGPERYIDAMGATKEDAHLIAAAPAMRDALKALSFAAQTTGGVAGRDEALVAAIADAEAALAKAAPQ